MKLDLLFQRDGELDMCNYTSSFRDICRFLDRRVRHLGQYRSSNTGIRTRGGTDGDQLAITSEASGSGQNEYVIILQQDHK